VVDDTSRVVIVSSKGVSERVCIALLKNRTEYQVQYL
jgi:hypothetical protein